ncbi:MAG: hypothetical protein IPK19_30330 [Chloroflexi bacterium]|nr:hypothetical protein [Chloroflexota bacterium]
MSERLEALARKKGAQFAAREDLLACALTGSLPRGRVWAGSDLDFYGFWGQDDDDFEDGVEDGIYWEIDMMPLSLLDDVDGETLAQAPAFGPDTFGTTPLEVLWGARVLFDRDGALERAAAEIAQLVADRDWLRRRAENYLRYGLTCLDGLEAEPPLRALLDARRIAMVYGVNAYWMKRGELLSSAIRIPERLGDHPQTQTLFRGIFNLEGRRGWEAFYTAYQIMPPAIREEADPDVLREILPAVELGMSDGGVCHFRFIAEGWLPLDQIEPLMGFEPDMTAQKARVLEQTRALLEQIEEM